METSIKGMIQGLAEEMTGIVTGVVSSADPLEIKLTNDEKTTLWALSLRVPRHLTDYTVEVELSSVASISGGHVAGSLSTGGGLTSFSLTGGNLGVTAGELTVKNALGVGDAVYLYKFNDGKKYYVLGRV